jgi:hypothetical protein
MAESLLVDASIDNGDTALVRVYIDGTTLTRVEWRCIGRYRFYIGTTNRQWSRIIPASAVLTSYPILKSLSDKILAAEWTASIEGA